MLFVSNKLCRVLGQTLLLIGFTFTVGCNLYAPKCAEMDPGCDPGLFFLSPTFFTRQTFGRYLYAATTGTADHRVYSYSMSRGSGGLTAVGQPIGAGNDPFDLTLHPSGRYIYATGSATGANLYSYVILDDGSLGLTTSSPATVTGSIPRGLVFSSDPTLAVLLFQGGANGSITTLPVDGNSGAVGGQGSPFGLGCSPSSLVVDPFGRYVYTPTILTPVGVTPLLVNISSRTLTAGTAASLPAISPGKQVITPDGKFLYVAASGAATTNYAAFALQPDGNPVATSTPTFSADGTSQQITDLDIAPGGKFLYSVSGTTSKVFVHSIDSSGALTAVAPGLGTSNAPQAVRVDPSGRYLYIAANNSAGAAVINIFEINPDGTLKTRPDISPITVVSSTPNLNTLEILPGSDW